MSEWAQAHRKLPPHSAEPGQWRNERTPYLREIMDCLSPSSEWLRVVLMKGAQIGATECGNNWVGYVIHHAPGPMMLVTKSLELAKRNSKNRIAPLIDATPELRERVRPARSRDSGNTILIKEFKRGQLIMAGAESAAGLRSTPIRYLFLDELDSYESTDEGDPVALAMARTRTFGSRKKVFMASTPLFKGISRIEAAFLEGDQRRFWVPCPHCGEYQVLRFDRLKWPKGKPEQAVYVCAGCGEVDDKGNVVAGAIQNSDKAKMLPLGEWRASAPGDGKTASFHISSLYTPVGWDPTWSEIASMWEKAQKDPMQLQTIVNTVFGETWKLEGDAPDWEVLWGRREAYKRGTVPAGGLFLTAGADVHPDRIEVQVVAWGRGKESWLVDHVVLAGNTALSGNGTVWSDLSRFSAATFPHAKGGALPIDRLAIDAKYNSSMVYDWVRQQDRRRVLAVHGQGHGPAILGQPGSVDINLAGKVIKRGCKVWPVDGSQLKIELYALLKLEKPEDGQPFPPGYCHFPEDLNEEFFKQLTAEQLIRRVHRGFAKFEWQNTRPGQRNEALDTRVYARAAATHRGIDRMGDAQWDELSQSIRSVDQPVKPKAPELRPSGWLSTRRGGWL